MKTLYFLAFFLSIFTSTYSLFSEEDPSIFHHVNVISGHLNLSFDDSKVQGPIPLPIIRTYSSMGALERSPSNNNIDLRLQKCRQGRMFQGGWNFFPHTNLLIEPANDRSLFKLYLPEPNGNCISYVYSHPCKKYDDIIFFKAESRIHLTAQLSGRNNPRNNLVRLNLEQGEAIVYLPDGGIRLYRGRRLHKWSERNDFPYMKYYYLLEKETLPSKHLINYYYDENKNLRKIESTNPSGKKIYSTISFSPSYEKDFFHLKLTTSDKKELFYKTVRLEKRDYLDEVESNCRFHEKAQFTSGRRESGARMTTIKIAGKPQFTVDYHIVHDKKTQLEWAAKPHKIPYNIDKVATLKAPIGTNGEEIIVAQFT